MTVVIRKINNENILVNKKAVYKDSNGNWIAKTLNQKESDAANEYIAALEKFIENIKK